MMPTLPAARRLRAALAAVLVRAEAPELALVHQWLDTWHGVGLLAVGLHRTGYDLDHVAAVVEAVSVPVIASGGAGAPEQFRDVFVETGASGALAATVFHDRLIAIPELKEFLARCGIEVRR